MSWPSSSALMLGYEGTSDGSRRRRYDGLNEDCYLPPQQRRKISPLTMSTATSEIPSPTLLSERQQQQQIPHQEILQQPSQPPLLEMTTNESTDVDKIKKLLEWELSTLGANDLRSHAWFHGILADRNEAERLLRQCVVEEHGIKGVNTIANGVGISPNEGQGDYADSDSDGLEDVSSASSENDFAVDDFLDGLVDENGMVPDPSTATSTAMAAALLIQQRRRMNGVLPSKRPKRPHRQRRHFYCFLVRSSLNIRPPGRYVVSCLRVDKYDDDNNDTNKFQNLPRDAGDELKRMKYLRRQYRRRQRRQRQHPVLHFVINEIILQPGTVYERSQFTFGDTLPTVATTVSTNVTVNNNGQRQCQPGFDSVPDLIRYYVGGADDNAVLSYGGNDGMLSNSSILPQTTHTEVRVRYPCNRRVPLTMTNSMTEITSKELVPEVKERVKEVCQNPRALTTATTLSGSLQIPACFTQAEPQIAPQNPLHQWHVPTPTFYTSNWKKISSSFRSSTRRTPSATVTSATACKPKTNAESATKGSSLNPCKTQAPVPGLLPLSSIPFNISPHLPTNSLGPSTLNLPGPSTTPGLSTKPGLSTTQGLSSRGPSPKSSLSTLPLTPMDSRSTSSSSVNPPSNKVPQQPSSQLIISSPSGSLKLAQRSSISVSLNKPPPLQMESSPLKNFGTQDKSLKSFETTEFLHKPSTSGTNRSNKSNSDGPCSIDMDAEIAAALAVADDDDSDVELTSEFNAPEPVVVRSSFARVNLGNGRRGRSRITQNRYIDNRNKIGTRQGKSVNQSHKNRSGGSMVNASMQGTECPTINDNNNQYKQIQPQKKQLSTFPLVDPSTSPNSLEFSLLEFENTKRMEQLIKEIGDPVKQKQNLFEMQNVILNLRREEEERVLEKWADAEMERLEWERMMKQNQDSDRRKNPPEPTEHEDFEVWRSRFTNSMKNKFEKLSDELRQERLFELRTQLIESRRNEIQQQRLLLKNLTESQASNTLTKHTNSDMQGILPEAAGQSAGSTVTANRSDTAPSTVQNQMAASECDDARNSIRLSNSDIVETMVNRWIGTRARKSKSNVRDVTKTTIEPKTQMDIHMLQRRRRQNRKKRIDHTYMPGKHLSSMVEGTIPNQNTTQIKQEPLQCVVDQQVNVANMISTSQSSTIMTLNGTINSNLTTTMCLSTVNNSMITSVIKVESADCDYENITEYNNIAVDDDSSVRDKNVICNKMSDTSNNNNGSRNNCAAEAVDYENIVSHHIDNSKNIDYANTNKNCEKQHNQNTDQKLKYDDSVDGIEVASALRAVHLAIIGDPEDGGKTVASTGRLAAALCRADGRTTVLPYRKCVESEIEEKVVGSILGTCPMQLLGQPGPAGRRARLDVIERFACLQYLVAMTVIVTPCLLLIGGSTNRSENECLEWSLEDEYEYRRRKFYYRCAGIGDWYFSGSNSDNDDDDDDAYQLSADSDFNAGYSLPPKEDWTIEKRHWLDLLNQHRAIALDKWIRTAADTKQAVGDVFGYRALMSALCSDRIQSLHDAWTTLRRLHTATAVAFESRLRPEFLGRRDKHVSTVIGESSQDLNEDDEDEIDMLLQLPPNATVPDATALAVLYEHMYNEGDYDVGYTSGANDNNSKVEKNSRPSSLFTSPLLLSPSPWSSSNSGISGGLGASVAADYGLKALHALCIQFSDWVKQSYNKGHYMKSKSKSPMLQLDMFRNNFRALLRQYGGDDFDDNSHDEYDEEYLRGNNQEDSIKKNLDLFQNKSNVDEENNFEYERHYEDKVESYIPGGGDYDECGDDDDDDATVICCSNSSVATKTVSDSPNSIPTMSTTADIVQKTVIEKKQQTLTSDQYVNRRHQRTNNREEYRWIKAATVYGQGPAPLNVVFRTELHVHLFWPSTLHLIDENNAGSDRDNVDHQLYVPAYGLGTTHSSLSTTNRYDTQKVHEYQSGIQSPVMLNDVIIKQLDRVTEDMRLRYSVMDKFLDGACTYSKEAAKLVSADPTLADKQKQFFVSK